MSDYSHLCGWNDMPAEIDKIMSKMLNPTMASYGVGLQGSGKGKVTLLYKYLLQVVGKYNTRLQNIGDCVSMGAAGAVDLLRCVQHVLCGTYEEWIAECATEPIYAGSRVEIAKGQLGGGDGSNGIWACQWLQQYGVLLRQKYGNIDLTSYSGNRARQWGMPRAGVPNELESIARLHPVKTFTQVKTWEELRDAIANGYPVTVACSRGFGNKRDSDGFITGRAVWPHQQHVIAARDDKRPGGLILNSWGDWCSGPKGDFEDIPIGSYWVDAEILERDMLSAGDSWAISNFESFPSQKLNLEIF